MGVWIETTLDKLFDCCLESHPVWVCGLKRTVEVKSNSGFTVTPCMGVWIETNGARRGAVQDEVTPCMGVWIETAALLCS